MTFNELISEYPFSLDSIAKTIGVSKQFLSAMHRGVATKRPELLRKHYLRIQMAIRLQAGQLATLKLTPNNIAVLNALPFSLNQLSSYCGQPTYFAERTIQNPLPGHCTLLQNSINQIGQQLNEIVITDYIEHDEVATLLLNQKGHQLLKIGF